MRQINEYIIEKLVINKNSQAETVDNFDDLILDIDEKDIPKELADIPYPDNKKRRLKTNGKENHWWSWWKTLAVNGPLSKPLLNRVIGNPNPTSYSIMYSDLSKKHIITYNPKLKKLEAQPVSTWKI